MTEMGGNTSRNDKTKENKKMSRKKRQNLNNNETESGTIELDFEHEVSDARFGRDGGASCSCQQVFFF